jgi:hypothetical protein
LSQQRVGPFSVIRAIGRLAYKLKILPSWKIHPVISVAHLEPHKPDPFERTQAVPLPDVVNDDAGDHDEWEVQEIIAQRHNKHRKRDEWLVRWKGFGPEQNTWEPLENLQNADESLEQFRTAQEPVTTASTFFLPSLHPPPLANAFLATISLV